jgi:hypothetical protein
MKKILLALALLLLIVKFSSAQCDKKLVSGSEKQEMLDKDGQVVDTKDDVLKIEFQKERIVFTNSANPDSVIASIKESSCDWKESFKSGRSFYKVEFTYPNGQTGNGTIEIEGKDSKVTIYVTMERLGDRKIRLILTKFEEIKA